MTINRLNQGVTNQVLVKAVSGQTTPLLELQDSTGAVVSSIGPTGALGGTLGDSGLVHIETRTLSAVVSESFNDVFSADYDNYKIVTNLSNASGGSTATSLNARYRVSATDASSANYTRQGFVAGGSSTSAFRATGVTSAELHTTYATKNLAIVEIGCPFLTVPTTSSCHWQDVDSSAFRMLFFNTVHDVSTSYTGITLIASSSTISGTVSIYGYRKS
jgi:hypothetical protein